MHLDNMWASRQPEASLAVNVEHVNFVFRGLPPALACLSVIVTVASLYACMPSATAICLQQHESQAPPPVHVRAHIEAPSN
jgi:hypothetical protein